MTAGKVLWRPDQSSARKTGIGEYMRWLEKRGLRFDSYQDLWRWSVDDLDGFWGSVWKYFEVSDADYVVLEERKMPGAKWFPGSDVNFAEKVFKAKRDGYALVSRGEHGRRSELSWEGLERRTASFAEWLRGVGVTAGDRVAAYLPNGPEAVVGVLACASVGAVWSSCSPDFGPPAVVDRFSQISPKVLVAADGYSYGGRWYDRAEEVGRIVNGIPSLKSVVGVKGGKGLGSLRHADWDDVDSGKSQPSYEPLPFDHPLWVLYSSGTTGLPKAIVHSQGGILVELLKELSLHNDVRPGDRFFWFTTTGWMMWNYLLGALLHGATLVLYNGSPTYPHPGAMWDLAEKCELDFMGTSAAFLSGCEKAGEEPGKTHRLAKLRGIGSTGSPLPKGSFEWVYSKVKEDVWLASISGGTDVCTAFVGGCPVLPVYSGEIQCRCLGAKVEAYDQAGSPLSGEVGELVLTEPMPSMPVYFWGDEDGKRYFESYFASYPGVWRHGDWIEITERGTCIIYGRSDATLKRHGVRIGTSEIYRAVDSLLEVADSLVVDVGPPGGEGETVLFVSLVQGVSLDAGLESRIRERIRSETSPRHVPDKVVQAPVIPKTVNGKKLEVPVKRVLMGEDPGRVVNGTSLADPRSMDFFVKMAKGEKA